MAKKIRFPLKLAEGVDVRTLEELREHFDLQPILEYYKNGKLLTWLEDRYLEGEAEAIRALDETAPDFQRRICQVFQVEYTGIDVDLEAIERRQERMKRLRAVTDEAEYIENIDRVAFDQEDLADLLDEDETTIYLCGEQFTIPASRRGITYVGVNSPAVHISGDMSNWSERNIIFKSCEVDEPKNISTEGNADTTEESPYEIGMRFELGDGVEQSWEQAIRHYTAGAEKGDAQAQYRLGRCYYNGYGVRVNLKKARELYTDAAEQGYAEAQFALGKCYDQGGYLEPGQMEKNPALAVMWYTKAAEQGYVAAQYRLGGLYRFIIPIGFHGFTKQEIEAQSFEWYKKAAEQGHPYAQFYVGQSYAYGIGVEKDIIKATDWYRKAAKNGNKNAEKWLKLHS